MMRALRGRAVAPAVPKCKFCEHRSAIARIDSIRAFVFQSSDPVFQFPAGVRFGPLQMTSVG
jgi:hypothetical protein